jgi:hypothetical protein
MSLTEVAMGKDDISSAADFYNRHPISADIVLAKLKQRSP